MARAASTASSHTELRYLMDLQAGKRALRDRGMADRAVTRPNGREIPFYVDVDERLEVAEALRESLRIQEFSVEVLNREIMRNHCEAVQALPSENTLAEQAQLPVVLRPTPQLKVQVPELDYHVLSEEEKKALKLKLKQRYAAKLGVPESEVNVALASGSLNITIQVLATSSLGTMVTSLCDETEESKKEIQMEVFKDVLDTLEIAKELDAKGKLEVKYTGTGLAPPQMVLDQGWTKSYLQHITKSTKCGVNCAQKLADGYYMNRPAGTSDAVDQDIDDIRQSTKKGDKKRQESLINWYAGDWCYKSVNKFIFQDDRSWLMKVGGYIKELEDCFQKNSSCQIPPATQSGTKTFVRRFFAISGDVERFVNTRLAPKSIAKFCSFTSTTRSMEIPQSLIGEVDYNLVLDFDLPTEDQVEDCLFPLDIANAPHLNLPFKEEEVLWPPHCEFEVTSNGDKFNDAISASLNKFNLPWVKFKLSKLPPVDFDADAEIATIEKAEHALEKAAEETKAAKTKALLKKLKDEKDQEMKEKEDQIKAQLEKDEKEKDEKGKQMTAPAQLEKGKKTNNDPSCLPCAACVLM